jgi:hypothetical protein
MRLIANVKTSLVLGVTRLSGRRGRQLPGRNTQRDLLGFGLSDKQAVEQIALVRQATSVDDPEATGDIFGPSVDVLGHCDPAGKGPGLTSRRPALGNRDELHYGLPAPPQLHALTLLGKRNELRKVGLRLSDAERLSHAQDDTPAWSTWKGRSVS